MDPIMASQALRLVAQNIDFSQSPSISDIASDLEQILQYVETGEARTASYDRVAGPIDWMKGLKRKVLNTKGEKKILDRIDHLKKLMKWCGSVVKKVRKGNDLADIASDEDFLQVFEGAAEFFTGGSEALNAVADSENDVGSALADLDEHWLENDDDEESDREIIENAISEFHSQCEEQISKNEKKLQKQKIRQKGGKKLPIPKSKQKPKRKPEPPQEEEEAPSEEAPEETDYEAPEEAPEPKKPAPEPKKPAPKKPAPKPKKPEPKRRK
jgi:hypothetical protein